MSSSTRATRSRFSSPAQAQPKNKSLLPLEPSATKGNEASKSFMERWLEPSVQAKTSFEEAGLAKFGVLENMAPLGSLPKARMFTGEAGSAIRKIILKTGAARAKEELDRASSKRSSRSPAGSPPPAKRPARDTSSQEPAAGDSEADVPRETTERTRRKLNRRAAATQDDAAGDESFTSSVKLEVGTPDLAQASATDDKTVVGVVGDDVGQHNVEGWQLSSVDGELPESLAQAADAETMNAFNQQMQQIKQEGSRDNKGCYYFVPPSEDDSSRSLPKSKSSSLGKPDNHDDDGSSEADTRAAKKAKTSHGLGATTEAAKTRLFGSTTTKAGDDQGDEGITATAQPGSAPVQNRKRRRDSESSGASLSPVANAADMDALDSPLARLSTPSPAARPTAATSAGASKTSTSDAPDRRQVNARARTTKTRSSDANSLSVNTTNAANTASPSTNSPRTAHGNMPGRLAASELLSLQGSQPEGAVSEEPPSSPVQHDQDETVWNRRREAQKVTNNYQASESAVRRGAKKSRPSTPVRSSRRTRQSTGAPASTRATRSAVKKPGDDADARSSSVVPSLLADESSLAGSRAVTPTKKPKGGLRVKSSPVKKQQGSAAGLPRPTDAPAPTNGSTTPKDSTADNDEYCSACGSDGDVVCCDGCPRSFHFECVDMVRSEDLPDEWFCNECIVRRFPSRVPIHRGIFAAALNNLEKSIPRAFALPKKVQNRFEGVKAGAGGEYEEVNAVAKGPAKKRNGYDELPDLHKQREDGQAVLCHSCQKPSGEKRAILPCSACPLHWHMDCMDPPLAVPPLLKTWKCPAHVDDVLADAPALAPAHKYRRVKNAQVIAPIFTRGMKNNGHIEIDWSDEPEPLKGAGWPDPRSFGRTYKVSANGVVLDFIEQLRRQGAGYAQREEEPRIVPTSSVPLESQQDSSKPVLGSALGRTVDEMQASLNLVALKRKRTDSIDYLTSALISEADENVLAVMARGSADSIASGRLSDDDKSGLRAMLAQMDAMSSKIRHLLGDKSQSPTVPTPIPGAATPPAEPSSSVPKQDNEATSQPIAEPTPPSTVDHAESNMELD